MAELKTKPSQASVASLLAPLDPDKRRDAEQVDALMRELTGAEGQLWGSNIVGYGSCHMVYASGRELDWFMVGFSPRKANLSLYIMPGFADYGPLLAKLGKHGVGKSCLYVKRLADVDLDVLRSLIAKSVEHMRATHGPSAAAAKKPAVAKKR